MKVDAFDFKQMLDPITPEVFFSEYWEKKPLILTDRGKDGYEDLLSLKDVGYLLGTLSDPLRMYSRFVNHAKGVKTEDYLGEDGLLKNDKVIEGFGDGNTIILNALHKRWDPIRKLSFGLENVIGHSVGVNMYLTPANAQGFSAHYDTHDVFILQLEGEKIWKIYERQADYPLGHEDVPFTDKRNPPIFEVCLKPGDLLYIPRGYVHEAATTKKYSMHLTVGIHVTTWADLIQQIALEESQFRRALPIKALLPTKKKDLDVSEIQEIGNICLKKEVIDKAIEKLKIKFAAKRRESFHDRLMAFQWIDEITEDTQLKKKEVHQYSLTTNDEKTTIMFGEQVLRMPAHVEPMLQYIIDTPQFSIKTFPTEHSSSSKFVLVRSLIKNGMLTLA